MDSRLAVLTPERLRDVRRVFVVGDLHGDADSLGLLLSFWDPIRDLLLFTGDYADRGDDGVGVVERVYSLLLGFPERVVALKGNHEAYSAAGEPEFSPCTLVDEAAKRWGTWQLFRSTVHRPFLDRLYLAAIIPGEVLFVHGGISRRIQSLADLERPAPGVEEDVLWSDLTTRDIDEVPNRLLRTQGTLFGRRSSASLCERLGVKRIIRAHQHGLAKIQPGRHHHGRVTTVVTSRVYSRDPYVLVLDPQDLTVGERLSLRSGQRARVPLGPGGDAAELDVIPAAQLPPRQRAAYDKLCASWQSLIPAEGKRLWAMASAVGRQPGKYEYWEIGEDPILDDSRAAAVGSRFVVEVRSSSRRLERVLLSDAPGAPYRQIG